MVERTPVDPAPRSTAVEPDAGVPDAPAVRPVDERGGPDAGIR